MTAADLKKQEAKESKKNNKIFNSAKANSPQINCTLPNVANEPNVNHNSSGKIIDSGGVNLGYIHEESNSHQLSSLKTSDPRTQDKR